MKKKYEKNVLISMFNQMFIELGSDLSILSYSDMQKIILEELKLNRQKIAGLNSMQLNSKRIQRNKEIRKKYSDDFLKFIQKEQNYRKKLIKNKQVQYIVLKLVLNVLNRVLKSEDSKYVLNNPHAYLTNWNELNEDNLVFTPYEFTLLLYSEFMIFIKKI